MKPAFYSNLATGIKPGGEVFFCAFNADAVKGDKDRVAGSFFEHAV